MKRERREERRREWGQRENIRGMGRKKEKLKDMVHIIKFHGTYSANMAPSTCKVTWGIMFKQEAFPGRIFMSKWILRLTYKDYVCFTGAGSLVENVKNRRTQWYKGFEM